MRICPAPLLACSLILTGIGGPALADPGVNRVEIRVSSHGLDLTKPEGAEQFLQRLSRAATTACGETRDTSPLLQGGARRFRRCQTAALSTAVAGSRSEMVLRTFAARRAGENRPGDF
jgi:UrcA family protein